MGIGIVCQSVKWTHYASVFQPGFCGTLRGSASDIPKVLWDHRCSVKN